MKRSMVAGIAGLAALLVACAAQAEHRHDERDGARRPPPAARPERPPAPYPHPWSRGVYLPQEHWRADVPAPGRYHLRPAPYGYHWVVVGRDAYLIQSATGLVVETAPGAVY